ncbi:LON peptidase substrate-binding domain-containing protein [Rhodothermus bifroesti]|jgi:ATP-dependent Lon protease|nr:LON peptidase substrate-binding domain-containing protein [Rhodothermus bifroesti]GBD02003.1 Lon protease 2 [bacterium HR18]
MERLPLFPLGVVLYPGERLPLHIFEPRYRDLIRDCLAQDVPFGIVLAEEGRLARVGSTARITRILARYADGRMDILVTGEERFRIVQLYSDRPYLTADVERIVEPFEAPQHALRERLITQHMRLLELVGQTVRPALYQDVRYLSYVVASNAGLTLEQQQEVLELLTENERLAYLVAHLERLLPQVEQMESVRRRIQSNGHFPPSSDT